MLATTTDTHTCSRHAWCTDHLIEADGTAYCRGEADYIRPENERHEAYVQAAHLGGEPPCIFIDGEVYTLADAVVFAQSILRAVENART